MPAEPTLAELMHALSTLGDLTTARGPRHPTEPETRLALEIERFLEEYPFLRRDRDYSDFLERYAGAFLSIAETALSLDLIGSPYRATLSHFELFGFSRVVSCHIVEGDEDDLAIIDADGFLQFAMLSSELCKMDADAPGPQTVFADKPIAFDATGRRPWGIYAKTAEGDEAGAIAGWSLPTYQWSWRSFREFLASIITGEVLRAPA